MHDLCYAAYHMQGLRSAPHPMAPAALQSAGVEWSAVTFVQADATDVTSCRQAVQRARVMINCAGPFRFLGENVVKACIAEGCHYLDLCGEPEFIERMQLKYHDEAKHANVVQPCCPRAASCCANRSLTTPLLPLLCSWSSLRVVGTRFLPILAACSPWRSSMALVVLQQGQRVWWVVQASAAQATQLASPCLLQY